MSSNGKRPDHFATSIHGVPLRLSAKQLAHVRNRHPDVYAEIELVRQTIELPDKIVEGIAGECMAVKEVRPGKFLLVTYRELEHDGFIITAFFSLRLGYHSRRKQLWP